MAVPNVKMNHLGRKIERIRELKGWKQDVLASKMGVSQQTISRLEQSEEIEEDKLKSVAEALEISVDAIRHFNEDAPVNHMNNIYNNHDHSVNAVIYYNLSDSSTIKELYEQLLKAEREKNELLQQLLDVKASKK